MMFATYQLKGSWSGALIMVKWKLYKCCTNSGCSTGEDANVCFNESINKSMNIKLLMINFNQCCVFVH